MWVPGFAPGSSHGPGARSRRVPEQARERVGRLDGFLAEAEPDLWPAQLDVVGAQRGDPRGALAVEQDQAVRDACRKRERVALQQRVGLA